MKTFVPKQFVKMDIKMKVNKIAMCNYMYFYFVESENREIARTRDRAREKAHPQTKVN